MHKNLVRIQERIVENVRENLKTLEISDERPVIISILACAERSLTEEEILSRTDIGADQIRKCIALLVDKELVVKAGKGSSGRVEYELNPDMEKIALRSIQSKIKTVGSNTKSSVNECESLLESGKAEFDDYDRLMARYLREKIGKMKLVSAVMTRRSVLLRLLDSSAEESAEIKRITIV